MVLKGQRNLTIDLARKITTILKISRKEEKYFLLMVQYAQCKSIQSRHDILEQMLCMTRTNSVRSLVPEQYEFYEKWYYAVMRELVEVVPVQASDDKSADLFKPSIKPREARQALTLLQKLGLIHQDDTGRFRRSDTLISCDDTIRSVAVSNFQSAMIDLAKNALQYIDRLERDISTVTLSIDAQAWEQIKLRCESFRTELLSLASTVEKPNRVIQVNLQCFPVTHVHNPEKAPDGACSEPGTEEKSVENVL